MTDQNDDNTHIHLVLAKETMVQHYRIIEKIGAGGMGEVYLAEDTKLKRNVALKFLPSHMCDDNDCRTRFTREAQAVAKLNHPNIITIYEVSDFNGRPFFAMEHIDGKTVHHYSYQEKLSLKKIVKLILQITEGLAKAHESGITHRDIKSINIMVNKNLQPKILDFGLATIKGDAGLTKAGSTLGTFAYMSPEQAQGKELDHRSDIFSLGVVFYELITRQSPFKSSNDAGTINNVINNAPNSIINFSLEIPQELDEVISKCLQKNPHDRFQETSELVDTLRKVKHSIAKNDNQQPKENDTSIAVLPFANMSADPENEYFADGLTEELLNVLAKNPDLKVTGRTSSFAFKGIQEDLRSIGKKLGVNTILEGSVRKAGNRVRITAQLVKTSDGFHLWSETYDRVIEDIFAVQDEISEAVAKELHITLLGNQKKKIVVNVECYELLLKAKQAIFEMNKSSLLRSIELFQKVIDIEPENTRAWAGIALAYFIQVGYGFDTQESAYQKSKAAGLKALELDNNSVEALEVMSIIRFFLEFHFEEALSLCRKAFELAPYNSQVISTLSLMEGFYGDSKKAIELLNLSIELDPLNTETYSHAGRIYLIHEQYEKSQEGYKKAIQLSPNSTYNYMGLGLAFLLDGKLEKALESVKQEKGLGYINCGLAIVYHAMNNKLESDKALNNLIDVSSNEDSSWAYQIAMVYGYRSEIDDAFKWLDIALSAGDVGIPQTKVLPYFKSLHSDPRWPKLLKLIGFTE